MLINQIGDWLLVNIKFREGSDSSSFSNSSNIFPAYLLFWLSSGSSDIESLNCCMNLDFVFPVLTSPDTVFCMCTSFVEQFPVSLSFNWPGIDTRADSKFLTWPLRTAHSMAYSGM